MIEPAKWTSVRVRKAARNKLLRIKRERRWPLGDAVEILADRELALLAAEKKENQAVAPPDPSGRGARRNRTLKHTPDPGEGK